MKRFIYLWILCGFLILGACSEDYVGQTPTDSNAPLAIESVEVKNTPGGAEIYYTLAEETDISYVKGVYYVKGVERVTRSSVYNNVLKVEGLGSTDPLEVTLYVVDHSENLSAPYIVTINPLTPVVDLIINSMQMQADFGGVNVTWENETGTEIGITILASNEEGILEEGQTYYNQLKDGNYSFRGYNDQPRTFGIFLTDKWGNVSDTIQKELTPIYEKMLDKSLLKRKKLPLDETRNHSNSYTFEKLFDDNTESMWITPNAAEIPMYFTVDLGCEAQLSRFKLYQRPGNFYYGNCNIRTFEVWGCLSYNQEDTSEAYWSEEWKKDWINIGDFEIFKPSGDGPVTNEDKEYAANGHEYNAPLDAGKIRYLRFVVKSNWSGGDGLEIAELTFWGNDK